MKKFIVKADDLRLNGDITKYVRLIHLCQKHSITCSIGAIGSTLWGGRYRDQRYISDLIASGIVELWNHSFNHRDMTQLSGDQIAWEIAQTNTECQKAFGFMPAGFGAPFNKTNSSIEQIASDLGMQFTYEGVFSHFEMITPEYNVPFDGQPSFAEFIKRVENRKELPVIVIQIHPARWLSKSFAEFERCLQWLLQEGYETTTALAHATGRNDYRRSIKEPTSVHDLNIARLSTYWTENAETYDKTLSNFSSYFLGRFTANARSIKGMLTELDADLVIRNVADVGCGLAQWALPFYEFNKECKIYVLDTNKTIVQALTDAQDKDLVPSNFKILCEDFTRTNSIPHSSLDVIVCANALNYIPIPDFIVKSSELCKNGAKLVILHQTSTFNEVGYRDAALAGNLEMAKERAISELRQQLTRQGFTGFLPARTTHSLDEIEALFYVHKFRLHDVFVPDWERQENGLPTFQGSVFIKDSSLTPNKLQQEYRIKLRKLICQAGYSALDDEIFSMETEDFDDYVLCMYKARSGVMLKNEYAKNFDLDYKVACAMKSKSLSIVCEHVLNCGTVEIDLLLAAFVACITENNLNRAKDVIDIIKILNPSNRTHRLAISLFSLLIGDRDAALCAIQ